MRLFLAATAAVLLSAGSAAAGPLTAADIANPATQVFNPANGHIYEFVLNGGAWDQALAAAGSRSLGGEAGYLATLTSAAEQDFVYSQALVFRPREQSPAAYWLGGSDHVDEGAWFWRSGPEAGVQFWQGNATGAAVGGAYQHWDFGSDPPQPNTDANAATEDYLELMVNISWNNLTMGFWGDDHLAGNTNGYIVEYGSAAAAPQAVPEPGSWATLLLGFAALGSLLRQRRRPALAH